MVVKDRLLCTVYLEKPMNKYRLFISKQYKAEVKTRVFRAADGFCQERAVRGH